MKKNSLILLSGLMMIVSFAAIVVSMIPRNEFRNGKVVPIMILANGLLMSLKKKTSIL